MKHIISTAIMEHKDSSEAFVSLQELRTLNSDFETAQNELKFEKIRSLALTKEKGHLKYRLDYLDLCLSVKQTRTADLEAKVLELASLFQQGTEEYAGILNRNTTESISAESTIAQDLDNLNILDLKESAICKPKRFKPGTVDDSTVVLELPIPKSAVMALRQENINLRKMNAVLTEAQMNRFKTREPRAIFELEIEGKIYRLKCDRSELPKLIEIRERLDSAFKEILEEAAEWQKAKERSDLSLMQMSEMNKFEISTLHSENFKLKSELVRYHSGQIVIGSKSMETVGMPQTQSEIGCGDAWVKMKNHDGDLIHLDDYEHVPESETFKTQIDRFEANNIIQQNRDDYDRIICSNTSGLLPVQVSETPTNYEIDLYEANKALKKDKPKNTYNLLSSSNSETSLSSKSSPAGSISPSPCETDNDDAVSNLIPSTRRNSFLMKAKKIIPKKLKSSHGTLNNYFPR